ncbi:MAG: hypothetical protein RLZZ213_933 [Cyanobacteriota bacterium]
MIAADAFLGCFLAPMSFFLALEHLSVVTQTLLFSLSLPFTAAVATLWLREKLPDRFVPLQEATRYLYCGRDWLMAQIREGVLREGIDFLDRSASTTTRKRYLVNPVSAQRWLAGADPAQVRPSVTTNAAALAIPKNCPQDRPQEADSK